MKKLGIALILACFLPIGQQADAAPKALPVEPLVIETQKGSVSFEVEMALTPAQQERGLMFRNQLPRDKGMVFIMPKDQAMSMWMKNTFIALDMLFVEKNGRIAHIIHNAKPESENVLGYENPVRAVLELAGGVAREKNIKVGDRVTVKGLQP